MPFPHALLEDGQQGLAFKRMDTFVAPGFGVFGAGGVCGGRHYIDKMCNLVGNSARLDTLGPPGDERRGDASLVAPVLVVLERGVAQERPRCIHAVPGGHGPRRIDRRVIAVLLVMHHLRGSAVVRKEHHKRVILFAHLADLIQQAAHLLVHAVNHSGVHRHFQIPVRFAFDFLPGQDACVVVPVACGEGRGALRCFGDGSVFRQHPCRVDEPHFDLPLVAPASQDIPSLHVFPPVFLDVPGAGLQGIVRSLIGDIEKERFVGVFAPVLIQIVEGFFRVGVRRVEIRVVGSVRSKNLSVDRPGARMPRHFACGRWFAGPLLPGIEMVDGAVYETVIAVESPVERIFQTVPLSGHIGAIARFAQHFRNGHPVPERVDPFAHADLVGIQAGHEGGPCGEAFTRVIELGESHALRRKAVEMRGSDFPAVRSEVREAHVVHHDEDDIGPVVAAGIFWKMGIRRRPRRPDSGAQNPCREKCSYGQARCTQRSVCHS